MTRRVFGALFQMIYGPKPPVVDLRLPSCPVCHVSVPMLPIHLPALDDDGIFRGAALSLSIVVCPNCGTWFTPKPVPK